METMKKIQKMFFGMNKDKLAFLKIYDLNVLLFFHELINLLNAVFSKYFFSNKFSKYIVSFSKKQWFWIFPNKRNYNLYSYLSNLFIFHLFVSLWLLENLVTEFFWQNYCTNRIVWSLLGAKRRVLACTKRGNG